MQNLNSIISRLKSISRFLWGLPIIAGLITAIIMGVVPDSWTNIYANWNENNVRENTIEEADDLLDRAMVKRALERYGEISRTFSRREDPENYAYLRHQQGVCYTELSDKNDRKEEFLKNAIYEFAQALKVRNESMPDEYATTQESLGIAYLKLAEVRKRRANTELAIECFNRALKIKTMEEDPSGHARIKHDIGDAYYLLATVRDRKSYLGLALDAYKDADKVQDNKRPSFDFAINQNGMGNVYRDLAGFSEMQERSLVKATEFYERALEILTIDEYPFNYAISQNDIGNTYLFLAGLVDAKNNLEQANRAYKRAVRIFTENKYALYYARLQNNLGNYYIELSSVEDPETNIDSAINAYESALKVLRIDEYPLDYGATKFSSGNAYLVRSRFKDQRADRRADLRHAIDSYREALEVFRENLYPHMNGQIKSNLETAETELVALDTFTNPIKWEPIKIQYSIASFSSQNMPDRLSPQGPSSRDPMKNTVLMSPMHREVEINSISKTISMVPSRQMRARKPLLYLGSRDTGNLVVTPPMAGETTVNSIETTPKIMKIVPLHQNTATVSSTSTDSP